MRLHTYIADLGGGTVQAAQWTEAGKSKRTAGHRRVVGTKIAGDCSVHSPGPDQPDKKSSIITKGGPHANQQSSAGPA